MSVELFRITDADVLRAKDVWESQCGMVELIGPQMATFHYHSVSPFFVAKFEWLNLAGRPIFTPRSRAAARPARVTQFIFSSSADSLDLAAREHKRSCFRQGPLQLAIACCSSWIDSNCRSSCSARRAAPTPRSMARSLKCASILSNQ